ncbi:nucleotide-binding universal stress UspA family protein [Streptacidiphilus sp. MAP12-20]|uniref:universal stress protein n=1 Tax=Streptacidiphilus sp. MAP12-20 TaxID=3156299 RepID=UPI003518E8E3
MSFARGSVVVGVSGTPGSLEALRAAVGLARELRRPLAPVLAWSPPGGELAQRRAAQPQLLRLCEREALARLRACFDAALGGPPADVPYVPFVVRGRPGPVLVNIADHPDDVMVVGSGPRGRLARLLHGGTARYCVARSRSHVLVVPPPALLGEIPRRERHRVPYCFDEVEQRLGATLRADSP